MVHDYSTVWDRVLEVSAILDGLYTETQLITFLAQKDRLTDWAENLDDATKKKFGVPLESSEVRIVLRHAKELMDAAPDPSVQKTLLVEFENRAGDIRVCRLRTSPRSHGGQMVYSSERSWNAADELYASQFFKYPFHDKVYEALKFDLRTMKKLMSVRLDTTATTSTTLFRER